MPGGRPTPPGRSPGKDREKASLRLGAPLKMVSRMSSRVRKPIVSPSSLTTAAGRGWRDVASTRQASRTRGTPARRKTSQAGLGGLPQLVQAQGSEAISSTVRLRVTPGGLRAIARRRSARAELGRQKESICRTAASNSSTGISESSTMLCHTRCSCLDRRRRPRRGGPPAPGRQSRVRLRLEPQPDEPLRGGWRRRRPAAGAETDHGGRGRPPGAAMNSRPQDEPGDLGGAFHQRDDDPRGSDGRCPATAVRRSRSNSMPTTETAETVATLTKVPEEHGGQQPVGIDQQRGGEDAVLLEVSAARSRRSGPRKEPAPLAGREEGRADRPARAMRHSQEAWEIGRRYRDCRRRIKEGGEEERRKDEGGRMKREEGKELGGRSPAFQLPNSSHLSSLSPSAFIPHRRVPSYSAWCDARH